MTKPRKHIAASRLLRSLIRGEARMTKSCASRCDPFRILSFGFPSAFDIRISSFSLLRFQRHEAAAALTIDAHQNLFCWFQFLADGDQVFRTFNGLLVHFLDYVAF